MLFLLFIGSLICSLSFSPHFLFLFPFFFFLQFSFFFHLFPRSATYSQPVPCLSLCLLKLHKLPLKYPFRATITLDVMEERMRWVASSISLLAEENSGLFGNPFQSISPCTNAYRETSWKSHFTQDRHDVVPKVKPSSSWQLQQLPNL